MELRAPSSKQARSIREATERINIWHGAVRAGKNIAAELAFANSVRHHDGIGDIALIGRTERTLERNVLAGHGGLIDLLGERNISVNRGVGQCTIFGRRCYLFGASDARSEGKIRGGTFSRIYGNEITLWPEEVFKMAMTRMSIDGAQFFGETNPGSPRHWLKREYIDRAGEASLELRAWHFTLEDNPTLSESYKSNIRTQFTGVWRKRFVEGLWVVAEGAIWDAFDDDAHVVPAVPEGTEFKRYVVGVDYGTSNPFVALLIGQDAERRYWVLDEWRWDSRKRQAQLTDGQYSVRLNAWIHEHDVTPCAWYVDPSAASFRLQLQRDHGWPVIDADNDVDDGLRVVAQALSAGRLHIVGCPELCTEIQSYAWDPKAQERGEDVPLKQDDHGPDALRYAILTHERHGVGDVEQYGWVA